MKGRLIRDIKINPETTRKVAWEIRGIHPLPILKSISKFRTARKVRSDKFARKRYSNIKNPKL